MKLILDFLKGLGAVVFALLAPFLLILAGVLIAGFGLYKDWSWVTNGGVIAAALGVMLIFRMGGLDD